MMNDRSILELLYSAKQNKIDLFLNEGQLQVKLPKDKGFDKSILEHLKANKEALTDFFKRNERGAARNNKINQFDRQTTPHIPLSFGQERMWFVDQLEGSVKYHLPTVIRFKGDFDKDALSLALKAVIRRHEILRTVIYEENGQGYQKLLNCDDWQLEMIDASTYKRNIKELHQYVQQLIDKPFQLSKDYMLRAAVITINTNEHLVLVTIHHIAADAWSMSILVNEVIELYGAVILHKQPLLGQLPIQYADYAVWQRNYLQGDLLEEKLNYWGNKLKGVSPLNLPTDHRPAVWSGQGAIARFTVNKKLAVALQQLGQQYESSMFMTLLTAFKILMYRYSGQSDICVGTSVANRTLKEVESLIGFFVNMLALRSEVSNQLSFVDLLQQVKKTTLEAYQNQDCPFEKVVDIVVKERDMSKNPLIQVMLIMLNTPKVPELHFGNSTLSIENLEHTRTLFDISFFINETDSGLDGWVEYSTDLFSEDTIARMIKNFTELLNSLVANPGQKVGLLRILDQAEERMLLIDFNNNRVPYPEDKSVVDLFEEQVLKSPLSNAVVFEQQQLNYQELNERSNRLAHYLRSKGVKDEMLVPVFMERSVGLMVSIIAILKTGGAYVPIDPKYPAERIAFMLADISANIIICTESSKENLSQLSNIEVLLLDTDWPSIQTYPAHNLSNAVLPGHLIYVMYTSGSTGTPKGTMIEHRSVVSLVKGVEYVSSTEADILLSTGSSSFDATTFEYWSMLLNGGQLILCNESNLLDKDYLKAEIRRHGVNKMWFTSSWFNQLVDTDISLFEGLQTLLVGGEKLSEQHIALLRSRYPGIKIINGYGPTENTTFSLTYLISETVITRAIPIGRPLNNRTAYIVDELGGLVPVGTTGEICVGGPGLARGYLNNADLTEKKFIANPFSTTPNLKMYKTGDLGRWGSDGNIEYQGRRDDQVKIRGYRVELGEVESVVGKFEGVMQNVVVAKEDARGRKKLVAYVVPNDTFDRDALISFVAGKLPDYMVPAFWVDLKELPLTANGKVDRTVLPDPELPEAIVKEPMGPVTELQAKLIVIWQELLDVAAVNVNDNFFELGGDSILAIQVVSRARYSGINLKVADVFAYQTIALLSQFLDQQTHSATAFTSSSQEADGPFELIPVQQWYFETQQTALSHFNQSVLLKVDKAITESELQASIEQIVLQHDVMRFKYYQKEGQWQQENSAATIGLIREDISGTSSTLEVLINEIGDKYQRSLNIEKGEISRIVWIETPAKETANRLLLIIHHLAVDGVSWRILVEDLQICLTAVKNNLALTSLPKSSSYKQWYEALLKYGKKSSTLAQLQYWRNTVRGFQPFEVDFNFTDQVFVKDTATFTVRLKSDDTYALLKDVPRVYHTEINDILLCSLAKVLCSWANKSNVVICLEGHGRESIDDRIDSSRTVGWFTSLYPVLINIEEQNVLGDLIKSVKEQLRQIPDKGLGYGVLRYLNKETVLQGREPWEFQFNYLGQLDTLVKESKWLAIGGEPTGSGQNEEQIVTEKISVTSYIKAGELVCVWRFSTRHFKEETIKKLASSYLSELAAIISHCLQQGQAGGVYTPSDYGLGSAISFKELDAFLEEDNDSIMSF